MSHLENNIIPAWRHQLSRNVHIANSRYPNGITVEFRVLPLSHIVISLSHFRLLKDNSRRLQHGRRTRNTKILLGSSGIEYSMRSVNGSYASMESVR